LAGGLIEAYRGSYTEYVPKRQQRYEERLKQWQAQQQMVEKAQEFYRRYGAASGPTRPRTADADESVPSR